MSSIASGTIAAPTAIDEHQVAFASWCSKRLAENITRRFAARRVRARWNTPLIVVVDDDPVVSITLSEVLRRNGFNAVWFNSSLDALSYIEEVPVDLLLSDITMPVLDGIDLAVKVKALQPHCRIFLLSAECEEPHMVDRIACAGLKAHLQSKPVQIRRLVSTLADLLGRTSTDVKSQ